MQALTITYQRVFNLGNYESERIELTLQVEEGETAQQVLKAAKRLVARVPPRPVKTASRWKSNCSAGLSSS
jgi:hypothetical protein